MSGRKVADRPDPATFDAPAPIPFVHESAEARAARQETGLATLETCRRVVDRHLAALRKMEGPAGTPFAGVVNGLNNLLWTIRTEMDTEVLRLLTMRSVSVPVASSPDSDKEGA
jgi:hypothetical protein